MRGNRIQRNLATASSVLAVLVLAGCSESGTRDPAAPSPLPPLAASISPSADTVQMGQTVDFTIEITGGDPSAVPAWTCASADAMVASAARTASGCSATGTGIGTTTITATVTQGTATTTVSASLRVTPPPLTASLAPATDTVQMGQTVQFTVEITGGDPNAEPAWTCASADTTVASASATASGCSAAGTGIGTTTIAATVTRGTLTTTASASLRVIPPPLSASLTPAADTVQTDQTVQFTVEITGGDSNAEPAWTCASADTTVASAARTASGCSATGTGTDTTTIAATVTRGTATTTAFASLWVVARTRGEKDAFAYWDANANGDLTCTEARNKDGGLKLPAYEDNRNGTGLIYDWLQRGRSSDSDGDGIACETTPNPTGYVPVPPRTGERMCPSGSPTWMGLPVCEEVERAGYDRDDFGSAYSSLEDEIITGLPKSGGQVYTPYTCKLFDIRPDGTAATDIEHIVALAEAYDSGLRESQFRTFAGDLANLTIADPAVNRHQKSDRDAAEWRPPRNTGWFAAKVVAVKQKYGLSVNLGERDALASMLAADSSRTVNCN